MSTYALTPRPTIQGLCIALLLCAWPGLGWSGPLDSVPLKPGAEVPEYCAVSGRAIAVSINPGGGSGTGFFAPWRLEFVLDVAVEEGKEIMVTLVTDEQYKALSAGRRPADDQPPMKEILSGVGSVSVVLPRGNYFFAFNNRANTATRIEYRCSYVRR